MDRTSNLPVNLSVNPLYLLIIIIIIIIIIVHLNQFLYCGCPSCFGKERLKDSNNQKSRFDVGL